jgi:hypothetical protein
VDLESASIETIGTTGTAATGAFAGCTSLKTFGVKGTDDANVVTLTGSATPSVIQANSFNGCESIAAVKIISNGAETYLGGAFTGCTGLKELTIDGAVGAGLMTFNNANTIPTITDLIWNISTMPNATVDFSGLSGLKKLTVTQTLTDAVGATAMFPVTTSFDTLELREMKQDENYALFNTLPASVTKVIIGTGPAPTNAALVMGHASPSNLFNSQVKTITFTGAIGTLGGDFFGGISGVTVNINDTPVAGFSASNSSDKIIIVNVGPNTPAFAATIFDSPKLEAINVNAANTVLCNGNSGDGVLYGKRNGAPDNLIQYPVMKGALNHSYIIPDSVRSIGDNAFGTVTAPNARLKELTISEGVSSIGFLALSYLTVLDTVNWDAINVSTNVNPLPLSVKYMNIGKKVRNIPSNFLDVNPFITTITIPENVETIGASSFTGCKALEEVVFYATNLTTSSAFANIVDAGGNATITSLVLGNNVTVIPANTFEASAVKTLLNFGPELKTISDSAFENCVSLTDIEIPVTLGTIGNSAFLGCDYLTKVVIHRPALTFGTTPFIDGSGASASLVNLYRGITDPEKGGPGIYTLGGPAGNTQWSFTKFQ